MADIDGILEHLDDPDKRIEIYTAFISKAVLDDSDREELKRKRGFSDQIIDLCRFKSCRQENKSIIEELTIKYGEEDLLDVGLLDATDDGVKPCSQLLGIFKDNKFVNNICIPYTNENGDIFFLRPHKFGFKGKGINLYCPAHDISADKTWIITESEFKAAAAIQFGFPAIGVPGIHSFAVNNFSRLKDFIIQKGIGKIVIIYDNEIKDNPEFSNFKPDVLKQWDTQWRAIDLSRKLLREIPDLSFARIGVLPATWMRDGKIDIDGALAQGRTESEFKSVVYKSIEWPDYLKSLTPIGKKIITRNIYREECLRTSLVKKKDNEYCMVRSKKIRGSDEEITFDEPISNFVMEIRKTFIEGDVYIREVVFHGKDGSISNPCICDRGNNLLQKFKEWVFTCGGYIFQGKQDDLDLIWKLESSVGDGREIIRPESIGHIKSDESIWLFKNAIVMEDGSIKLPDKDGNIWVGLTGYLPQSIKQDTKSKQSNAIPSINIDENLVFGLPELKIIVDKMEIVFQTKAAKLAVGWLIACLLSDEIYRKYSCFPILFIDGIRESGKTTLGNWIMAMAGYPDTAGDALSEGGTTQAGAIRNLSWFSCLPYWLDEYRNNSKIKQWDGFFRNAYQRQSPSKGTLGEKVRSQSINAGIILSGEESPQDNALLSRCVIVPLTKKRDLAAIKLFDEIEALRIKNILSRLAIEVIKLKKTLLPSVLDHIDGWKKRLLESGVGERIALNYSIPAVCYDLFFLRNEDSSVRHEFTKWVIEESHRTEVEKESEHMLSVFMDDLITLHEFLEPFYEVYSEPNAKKGKRRIAIHFATFYSRWTETYRKKGLEQFKKATMLNYMKETSYFVENHVLKRVGGKPARCLVLSLDPEDNPPDGLLYLADGVAATSDLSGISDALSSNLDKEPLF